MARRSPSAGAHVARVEVTADGREVSVEWPFVYTPLPRTLPGPDSPPALAVIEREDGEVDVFAFGHTPTTCGEVLTSFFCASHREFPFTPFRMEEGDFFAGIFPADETIRPTDDQCFTALAATDPGPEAPTDVTLEPLPVTGGTGATIRWQDESDEETCYVVERATWGQYPPQIQVLATLPPDTTTYVDDRPYGAPGGVAYRVYAATTEARSEYSEAVAHTFTTPATAPSPVCFGGDPGGEGAPALPTDLTAELEPPRSRAGWGVHLRWDDNADGEACYVVEVEDVEVRAGYLSEPGALPANTTEVRGLSVPFSREVQTLTYRVYAATGDARSHSVEITVEVPGIPAE